MDNGGPSDPERLVFETRKEAKQIREVARQQLMRYGRLDAETHLDLAEIVLEYNQTLREYDDDPVADDEYYPDIRPLQQAAGQQTERTVTTSGEWDKSVHTKHQPAVLEFPARQLIGVINRLDRLARKIGFSAKDRENISGGSRLPNPNNLTAEPPVLADESSSVDSDAAEFESCHFFRSLYQDVEGDRGGGAIVIVDAEDARTGVGKTGAACGMAEFVSWYFGYEIQERDGVLSGQEYLDLFEEHPNEEQVSACVWDEAVGAGSGDARRAMAQENVDLGRAWQLMRDRKVITFVTLPDWGDLDSRLQKLADYRVWCRRDIGSMQAYEIGTTFEGGDIRTRGLGPGEGAEPIAFPDVTEDSDLYQAIKEKKNKVQESDSLSADELVKEEEEGQKDEEKIDVHEIADKVAESIDDYISVNPTNGQKNIKESLIKADSDWELTNDQAEQVKELAKKRVVEI